MNQAVLDFMLKRRSVLARQMSEPGPNEQQLKTLLTIAARVPDHKKLEPWRFLVIQGEARKQLGEQFAEIRKQQVELPPQQYQDLQQSFMRAPLVIAVIFSPIEQRVPKFEQLLSTGAVCQHINIAAGAMGFGSQWITGWSCEDQQAHQVLGLTDQEMIAGYMYIGSTDIQPEDRKRPDLGEKVTHFMVK